MGEAFIMDFKGIAETLKRNKEQPTVEQEALEAEKQERLYMPKERANER